MRLQEIVKRKDRAGRALRRLLKAEPRYNEMLTNWEICVAPWEADDIRRLRDILEWEYERYSEFSKALDGCAPRERLAVQETVNWLRGRNYNVWWWRLANCWRLQVLTPEDRPRMYRVWIGGGEPPDDADIKVRW